MIAKEIMYDYLLVNKELYQDLGLGLNKIAANIKNNRYAAEYYCLKLAADCF
jgi:hypothetical protein